jgi:ketosteroid isomerase-like protein
MSKKEMIEAVYAAINRDDSPSAMQFFDPQIERIEPTSFPSAGTYLGHEEVQTHLTQGRETWAEGKCEPEKFIGAGDQMIVFLHVRVRLKKNGEWIEGRFADGFTFRNGLIVQMITFVEKQEALEWVGAGDPI